MRKTIAKVLIMALLMSAFCLTAFAAFEGAAPEDVVVMRATGTIKINQNMSAGYSYSPNGGALYMACRPNPANGWTLIHAPGDIQGYAYVFIRGINGASNSANGRSKTGDYIDSGVLVLSGESYALQAIHSGYKTVNGSTTSYAYETY